MYATARRAKSWVSRVIEREVSLIGADGKVKHDTAALAREIFAVYAEYGSIRIAEDSF